MKTSPLLLLGLIALISGCASTPADRIARDPQAFATLPAAAQERVRKGQVDIGDSEAAVRLALGEPSRRVQRREQAGGESEVWIYESAGPRFSFSFGVGTAGRHSALGAGVATSTPPRDEEAMRVEFQQGRVVRIESRKD